MYKFAFIFSFLFLILACSKPKTQEMNHQYTNDLINETSPYLLQHAHNPVHWKPWNQETLELAKKENKLILISVGYSACHWCHVMEHESFEDSTVAKVMNENYINIKVDREERPDVDQVYMEAVQLMTGRGGWPLNCIALPDGRPVWGGTYFKKEDWKGALLQIADLYKDAPNTLIEYAEKLSEGIKTTNIINLNKAPKAFTKQHLETAVTKWQESMDFDLGGHTQAPKFPMPNTYEFLLRYAVQTNNTEVLDYVKTSLNKMTLGGIFDQIGGGFARYSVDTRWHIPHFEKMLYDNGQLVSLYSNAYLVSKNPLYKATVKHTLDFVARELTTNEGAFYAALDADSKDENGHLEEGAYYVWTQKQLKDLLKDDFDLFSKYYNVNEYGFWEKDNYNLIRTMNNADFCEKHQISEENLKNKVKNWKAILLAERNKRERPRLDDKALTSWNALMLKGYVDAYKAFENDDYLQTALKNARFIKDKLFQKNGGLWHTYKKGNSTINAYLEDYATTIDAFISLYEVTLDTQWLNDAKQFTDYVYKHFHDEKSGLFFFTSELDDALITRKIDTEDNVISSSNSIMARNLFKLSHYFTNRDYLATAEQMLHNVKPMVERYPSGFSNWLQLEADLAGDYYEVAVVGEQAKAQINKLNKYYLPNKIITGSTTESDLDLLKGKFVANETYIYVCVDGACQMPQQEIIKAVEQINLKL